MENRRQTFRVALSPQEPVRAELHKPEQRVVVPCEVLNLSLSGMRVRLHGAADSLRPGDAIVAHLLDRGEPSPATLGLSVPARLVQLKRVEDGVHCGVHFLRIANATTHESVERTLGRFLLAEQRRLRERGG